MSVFSKFLGKARAEQLELSDGSGLGKSSILKQARVTLTNAQLLALHTTPVALVAAPGAGKYIDVVSVNGVVNPGAGPVAFTGNNNMEFRYTDGSGAKVTGDGAYAWVQATTAVLMKAIAAAVTPVANAAVVAATPVANWAAGDGTITLEIFYRVVTLP